MVNVWESTALARPRISSLRLHAIRTVRSMALRGRATARRRSLLKHLALFGLAGQMSCHR